MQILEQLKTSLLGKLPLLLKLIDNFALLDMLNAFAMTVTASQGEFVKPSLTANGPLAIQQVITWHHQSANAKSIFLITSTKINF